jgi:hypothetical protein
MEVNWAGECSGLEKEQDEEEEAEERRKEKKRKKKETRQERRRVRVRQLQEVAEEGRLKKPPPGAYTQVNFQFRLLATGDPFSCV